MIFKLKLTAIKEVKKYKQNSAFVTFCKSNKGFEKLLKEQNLQVSRIQKDNFKNDKEAEVQIWQTGNPELVIIKKSDDSKKLHSDYFRNYIAGLIQSLEKLNLQNLFIQLPEFNEYKIVF